MIPVAVAVSAGLTQEWRCATPTALPVRLPADGDPASATAPAPTLTGARQAPAEAAPLSRHWQERTAAGQAMARPPAEPEGINSGPEPRGAAHRTGEGSVRDGCFTAHRGRVRHLHRPVRHPHNGYFAGDFSQTSRSAPTAVSYAERRDVPRAGSGSGTDGAAFRRPACRRRRDRLRCGRDTGHLTGVNNPRSRPRSRAVTHPPRRRPR